MKLVWLHVLSFFSKSKKILLYLSFFCCLGPDDKLFKRLRDEFDNLDSTPKTFWEWPKDDVRKKLGKRTLDWASTQMDREWPREDYRELIELIVVFLSGKAEIRRNRIEGAVNRKFQMKKPGQNTLIITFIFLIY